MKAGGKILALAAALGLMLAGCADITGKEGAAGQETRPQEAAGGEQTDLRVHFIDVGQGDSILVQSGEQAMLVDGGTNESGEQVVDYLQSQGVKRLDYLVGTHPHEDHIGGLDNVIRSFQIGTVIMPEAVHTTRTYEDVLDALLEKGLSVTVPVPGTAYELGTASFTILAPGHAVMEEAARDGNLNNMSVGLRLVCKDTAFVLCGDAEAPSEEAMVESGLPLHADVLKLGHHGSSTSSCPSFLEAVSPSIAVISCGRDNSYGHPHQETLEMLDRLGIQIYRTDQQGTVVAESDGSRILWSCGAAEPGSAETAAPEDPLYILNQNTKKFHLPDCSAVNSMKEENRTPCRESREALMDKGYSPCGSCSP